MAALFVQPGGTYSQIAGVDCWDEARDARGYAGPHPVVAHPPCDRWGRFWWADGSKVPGNDGGLFAAALEAVRRWGGVLEHPEGSHAWRVFDLPPAVLGAWCRGICGGWSTCVGQSAYGHRARKLTWLYYFGDVGPAPLDWSAPATSVWLAQPGRCSAGKPRRRCACERCREHFGAAWLGAERRTIERMGPEENAATPRAFAEVLIDLACKAKA